MDSIDTFSILISTDQHLGFLEKDPVRKDDSFRSFEELLQVGVRQKVDFILFGGDLFHENKPSRPTIVRTMELLRKYTWSNQPVMFDILSNPRVNFPPLRFDSSEYAHSANFHDPNINVGIPIFAIHGNHDDPSGEGSLCALDMFHASGLLNYFGKQDRVDHLVVSPILLKKGSTQLALYGFGSIRDERLYNTFKTRNVKFERVAPSTGATSTSAPKSASASESSSPEKTEEWFHMLVVHQNRVKHGEQYLPETLLDDFLSLVVWGHEHECKTEAEYNTANDFYVLQPGSSVATSLSEGESKLKHAFIVKINNGRFKIDKYPLRTVRSFVMKEVALSQFADLNPQDMEGVKTKMATVVREMIDEVKRKWSNDNPDKVVQHGPEMDRYRAMPLPLIRLKVEITGFTNFNVQQFGQQFVKSVANPQDILIFYRKRVARKRLCNEIGTWTPTSFLPRFLFLFYFYKSCFIFSRLLMMTSSCMQVAKLSMAWNKMWKKKKMKVDLRMIS